MRGIVSNARTRNRSNLSNLSLRPRPAASPAAACRPQRMKSLAVAAAALGLLLPAVNADFSEYWREQMRARSGRALCTRTSALKCWRYAPQAPVGRSSPPRTSPFRRGGPRLPCRLRAQRRRRASVPPRLGLRECSLRWPVPARSSLRRRHVGSPRSTRRSTLRSAYHPQEPGAGPFVITANSMTWTLTGTPTAVSAAATAAGLYSAAVHGVPAGGPPERP